MRTDQPTKNQQMDDQGLAIDDDLISDNLMEQFAGFYVLSVIAINVLMTLRAEHAKNEAQEAVEQPGNY